jgi:hypothetical protein
MVSLSAHPLEETLSPGGYDAPRYPISATKLAAARKG